MKKIKVVQLFYGFHMGGAEALVKDYALALDKDRFDVVVLCYAKVASPYYNMLKEAGVHIEHVFDNMPTWGRRDLLSRGINHFFAPFVIKRCLRRLRPDVVHVHLALNWFVRLARLPKTVRIFYTHHFEASKWKENNQRDVFAAAYLLEHYKMKIIALHQEMRRQLCDIFDNKYNDHILVLHNGVDADKFINATPKEAVRAELGIREDAFVAGHVGRFTPQKNHEYLLKVFREIKQRRSDARLLLIGSGEDREKIIALSREYGIYDSLIIVSDRTDVHHFIKAMDIMLFPSTSEGSPIVLVEAQFSGVKCLVSDIVTKEVVFSNLLRYRSIQENPADWAVAALAWGDMCIQYENPDEWKIETIVKQLEKLYLE